MTRRFIGLMSGTSLDGVDGVLAAQDDGVGGGLAVRGHAHAPYPAALRAELLALNGAGPDELHRAALAANALTRVHAGVVQRLLSDNGLACGDVCAIGAHGQTVRHRPGEFASAFGDATGYTLQLINGSLLAEATGVDVVCDFRSRDLAAGGIGAPLVPAYHAAAFGKPGCERALLNVGGISNLTVLGADGSVVGFDCGPGNVLLDAWCSEHRGQPYDADGAWAAGGRVDGALLQRLLAEPYFALQPPKSTGRDLFNMAWLKARLAEGGAGGAAPVDVMATLVELTARTVAVAVQRHARAARELHVCGGGARNGLLMRRLSALLPGVAVQSTEQAGIEPEHVEALAFAWLARAFLQRQPIDLTAVTGARGPRVLGALYPAG